MSGTELLPTFLACQRWALSPSPAGLNDAAARVIASELNAMQPAIADKAEQWGTTTDKAFLPGQSF